MATPKPTTSPLIAMVANASTSDLEEIDKHIADKQEELDASCKRLEGEISSLRTLRKVIDVRLNGRPERKPRDPSKPKATRATNAGVGRVDPMAPSGLDGKLIGRIVAELTKSGPMHDPRLAERIGETVQAVRQSVSRCPGLVKRLSDQRLALPGFRDPNEDD